MLRKLKKNCILNISVPVKIVNFVNECEAL